MWQTSSRSGKENRHSDFFKQHGIVSVWKPEEATKGMISIGKIKMVRRCFEVMDSSDALVLTALICRDAQA